MFFPVLSTLALAAAAVAADKVPLPLARFARVRRAAFTLANGQEAQALNRQAASLSAASACQDGQSACVNGGFAQCVGGKFVVAACSGGLECFALPLVVRALERWENTS